MADQLGFPWKWRACPCSVVLLYDRVFTSRRMRCEATGRHHQTPTLLLQVADLAVVGVAVPGGWWLASVARQRGW